MKRIKLTLGLLGVFCLIACNKDKNTLLNKQPEIQTIDTHITTLEEDDLLPPIVEYFRLCQPKEIIRNTSAIEGYTDKQSYDAGETVFFYIHSRTPIYDFKLYRFGQTQDLISSFQRQDGSIQNYLCYAFAHGCDWDLTFGYDISSSLLSGFYSAEISNSFGKFWVTFIVKAPSKNADVAVIASTNTWCAYNKWGGGSFYKNNIEEETYNSENLSFLRPNDKGNPQLKTHLAGSETHLLEWFEKKSIRYDMYADVDLHENGSLLSQYKVIILQTHPEYHSKKMYRALENFVRDKGNLMYLGANGLYAKVVYDPMLKILETRAFGGTHHYDKTTGGLWRNLNEPESALLGVQYDRRGYKTFHPYSVKNENHWIFSNTNLKYGDTFGGSCGRNGASGHETDKITNYSPSNLVHLAKGTNPDNGGADMIYYELPNGGKVFSVGSITYTSCINSDPTISIITENVINEFLK